MDFVKDNTITEILKLIAPGTKIREGLENILKAKTGGLIVIGDTKEVLDLVDGGFNLNVDYTPSRLYELAKMDGAIVLSADLKRILYANAQLIPSPEISTNETGTRHRTAERTAKQTGEIVISVSQRRNVITIFKGDLRYVLQDSSKVITKANQALQTAEKYKKVFDDKLNLDSVFSLRSKIIEIKHIKSGETVGYDGKYIASKDEIIGIVPIGYRDGIIRHNTGRYVYINDKKYKIIGNICMDMLFVLIDKTVNINDTVYIIKDNNHINEIAKYLDTINYEIMCSISDRVDRKYIEE